MAPKVDAKPNATMSGSATSASIFTNGEDFSSQIWEFIGRIGGNSADACDGLVENLANWEKRCDRGYEHR